MTTKANSDAHGGAMGRAILAAVGKFFQGVRALLGYVSLTATVLSGLALLLKRSFAEAALAVLADLIGPLADVVDYARRIVAVWDVWVVQPVLSALASWLHVHPPVWAVEVGTLLAFSAGPAIRAVWTARAARRRIRDRLNLLGQLRVELSRQKEELATLQRHKQELQKAIDHKDWNRFKSAVTMAGSLAFGAMDALNVLQGKPLGPAARNMHLAVRTWQAGQRDWSAVQAQIDYLERAHGSQAVAVQAMADRIRALEAADGGLLRGLDDAAPAVADQAIRTFVARQMRITVAISRFSLAFAAAVVAAYGVDWFLLRG